jgi:ATP-dependent DNA helicase RecG
LSQRNSQETLYGNHSSKPRNLNIANAFFKAGFIDTWGRGYKKIREGFEPAGIPMPKVENFCGGVQVTIERTQFMKMLNVRDVGKDVGKGGGDIPIIELTERQRVILELISADPTLSAKALSEKMSEKMSEKSSVNERTIERDIAKLKKLDYLRRIGGRKDGHWEVNIPLNSVVEIV